MEILTWNISSGGFEKYEDKSFKPRRLDGLVRTVRSINPDVVSLVDTYRWTEVFTPGELGKLFGYENVFMVTLDDERLIKLGHDNGITIMTRLPVERFDQVRLHNRNAIRTVVKTPKVLDLFSVYLDDLSEDTRLEQTTSLLETVRAGLPTVIMGDLNTVDKSEVAEVESKARELYAKLPMLEEAMGKVATEMMRAEVTKKIKDGGFTDLGNGTGETYPT